MRSKILTVFKYLNALRQVFLIVCIATMFTVATPNPSLGQQSGDQALVATQRLNLRAGPGAEHPVIQGMPEGTELSIIRLSGGWAQVSLARAPSVSGWTSAKFLQVVPNTIPKDSDSFFAAMDAKYAQDGAAAGKGYIPELDVYYVYYCNRNFGLALYRPSDPEPVMWEKEEWCVSGVEAIDVDRDLIPEIVYHVRGGGAGVVSVVEKHVYWPKTNAAPQLGYSFLAFQNEQSFLGQFEVAMERRTIREMRYGDTCRTEQNFCPDFGNDPDCRPAKICAMTQNKTMRVMDAYFPARLRSDPQWASYIQKEAADGVVLVGDNVPSSLADLSLTSIEEADTGERQELSDTRKRQVVEWLN